MDIVLPVALSGVLVTLLTQGLKSIAALAHIDISGWGSFAVAAVVAGLMAFGNSLLGNLPPDLAGVIVGFISYLLIATGSHSVAKILGGK